DFGPRSPDDIYILYTGGTTGMPKGVVWRHEDVFYALGGGIDPMTNTRVTKPQEIVDKGRNGGLTMMPIAPLMHGASQWSETGSNGMTRVAAGNTAMKGGPTVNGILDTVVLDDDGNEVQPGSGVIGKVARRGNIPIGYYKDPEKTEATFPVIDGVRYAMPGD